MPEKSLLYGLHSVGEAKVEGPELVSRQRRQFRKDLQRLANIYGLRGKARVRHNSHKSCLGKCTRRPLPPSQGPEPVDDLSVVCVLGANQGDQDVEIEQVRRHSSSASSALTCSAVIGSSEGPKSNTGMPSSYFMRDFFRVARTINSEIALPKVKSRPFAYCAAITAASSSKEIVVLMLEVYHN